MFSPLLQLKYGVQGASRSKEGNSKTHTYWQHFLTIVTLFLKHSGFQRPHLFPTPDLTPTLHLSDCCGVKGKISFSSSVLQALSITWLWLVPTTSLSRSLALVPCVLSSIAALSLIIANSSVDLCRNAKRSQTTWGTVPALVSAR